MALVLCACHQTKSMDGKVVRIKGSYALSCRNVVDGDGGALSAECLDAHRQFHVSSLPTSICRGDIANSNGILTCPH